MAHDTLTTEVLEQAIKAIRPYYPNRTIWPMSGPAEEYLRLSLRASNGDEGARVELLKREIRARLRGLRAAPRPPLP
jgi:hypothetical protein